MKGFPAGAVAVLSLAVSSHAFSQNPGATSGSVLTPATRAPGAQRPGLPPRDTGTAVPTGTARIRGRVIAADSGAPLRRVQVAVTAAESAVRRTSTTDGEGRYEFAELPAGRYTINASKGGYVGLQYGQRRPFEPGTPVTLAEGQTIDSLNMSLPRGSVIAGRVTDEFGEPIASAQVQAQRYQYGPDGQRRLQMVGMATSDDLGQFRVFGLMPGEYVLSAVVRGPFMIVPGNNAIDTSEGYLPTYYPGTVNVSEAQALSLAVGQETAVQFSLSGGRMARVSGRVVDSSGRAVSGAMLMLRSTSGGMFMSMGGGQTAADGTFTLSNVAPGEHTIDVQPSPRPGVEAGNLEFGSMPISVGGTDLVGLRIVTGKGAKVTGRVVFEGQSPRTGGVAPLRVMTQGVDPGRLNMFGSSISNGMVGDDGSFELTGGAGTVFFRVMTPPGWTLKSVSLEGEDITDMPFDLTGKEAVSGLRIVLTDRLTDISGQVTDSRGQTLKDYMVVILPAEPMEGTAATRFLRVARPDQDGRFRVRGMPSGRYAATAVESLEQGRQFVPEVQSELRRNGRSFSVAEGASVTIDLKLTSGF